MHTDHILSLLIEERDKLNRAIQALLGPARRPGRPKKNPSGVSLSTATDGSASRRGMSAALRKAQSARMKAYWAAKRKKKV